MIGKFRCTKDFWNDDYSQKKVIERLQLTDIGIVEEGDYVLVVGDSPFFDEPGEYWLPLLGQTDTAVRKARTILPCGCHVFDGAYLWR